MIRAEALSVQIGGARVCEAWSCTVTSGKMIAVMGPNGSGKTSLMKTLAGLLSASSGEIFLQNKPLQQYSVRELARTRSFLFQESIQVLSCSVRDFVSMGRYPMMNFLGRMSEMDHRCVEEALALLSLTALQEKNIQALSGGERRRAAIAQTLVQETPILFLDEPTNHLDAAHSERVLQHLRHLATLEQRTIVMATHDFKAAKCYCDEIISLDGFGFVSVEKKI